MKPSEIRAQQERGDRMADDAQALLDNPFDDETRERLGRSVHQWRAWRLDATIPGDTIRAAQEEARNVPGILVEDPRDTGDPA